MSGDLPLNVNIKEPRWDQGTFMGRAQHFFMVTDPRNVLLSSEVLEDARVTVENYRSVIPLVCFNAVSVNFRGEILYFNNEETAELPITTLLEKL